MKKSANIIFAICALVLLSFGAVADDDKDKIVKEHFEFTSDVMVGNTMVKKGFYLIKYNTETGMVKVVDETDKNKVIATAKATMKTNEKDFERDEIVTREMSGHAMLIGLRMGGKKQELTLSDHTAGVKQN
ncbi:MAG TPA: hypothetical protein VFZ34_14670 [Blastocatellia bacterium]|nr:hypothetical protein [Blastocatellia bacterium]